MYDDFDRYWLLTWTTYGTWLPGERRGFVSPVPVDAAGKRVIHNVVDTPYDADMPQLREAAAANLKCNPIYLTRPQAVAILEQFHETSAYRGHLLLAAALMRNHAHIVVAVAGDPEPENLLRDYKSYASRRLNRTWGKPRGDTWWTKSGSKRKLAGQQSIIDAVAYVRDQALPLATWIHPDCIELLGGETAANNPPASGERQLPESGRRNG